jgi:hypothetical protein
MAGESEMRGVKRDEFYSIVALLFFSLFAVVAVLSFDPAPASRVICNMILFTTFVGAGAWFLTLSSRERQRQRDSAPKATACADAMGKQA